MSSLSPPAPATENDTLLAEIVDAVTTAEQCKASDLPPLYETIDYEMLTRVVEGPDTVKVTFEYLDHTVTVNGDGRVQVNPNRE